MLGIKPSMCILALAVEMVQVKFANFSIKVVVSALLYVTHNNHMLCCSSQ